MRVLLSAYACQPGVGSEQGKAWQFACTLAELGHEVTVLSCESHHRLPIEALAKSGGLPPRLRFVWHDPRGMAGPGYADARGIRRHYMAWQLSARGVVKKLLATEAFDVIHHVSWAVLRWPSFLGGLGPRFVFGPVGGATSTPWRLRRGFPRRGHAYEIKRDLANAWGAVDPLVWWATARCDVILVGDEATRRAVPLPFRHRAHLWPRITSPARPTAAAVGSAGRSPGPQVLTVARLEAWKGLDLALEAFARFCRGREGARYRIAGSGPDAEHFRARAQSLGIADRVEWLGHVAHERLDVLYAEADVFLFPSLHDTGSQALGEALHAGLPVVCLDRGGPGIAVTGDCGIVVPSERRSFERVAGDLAAALTRIDDDPSLRRRLGRGAAARADELSDRRQVPEIVRRFYRGEDAGWEMPLQRASGTG